MRKNKDSMKTELTDILEKYMNPKDYKLDMCANEILTLFSVSNCDHKETTIAWGEDDDKCTKCGLTWAV